MWLKGDDGGSCDSGGASLILLGRLKRLLIKIMTGMLMSPFSFFHQRKFYSNRIDDM